MIWRSRFIVERQRNREADFGCRKTPVDVDPLGIEHNPYEMLDIKFPWSRRLRLIFMFLLICGFLSMDSFKFYHNFLWQLTALYGMLFGPWILVQTGGYVRLSQLPGLMARALRALLPW